MNENQTLSSREYSLIEWLGYVPHRICFLLEFVGTEFFSFKIERWLKRLTLSWKFNDQKFQETKTFHINFKKKLDPV